MEPLKYQKNGARATLLLLNLAKLNLVLLQKNTKHDDKVKHEGVTNGAEINVIQVCPGIFNQQT